MKQINPLLVYMMLLCILSEVVDNKIIRIGYAVLAVIIGVMLILSWITMEKEGE